MRLSTWPLGGPCRHPSTCAQVWEGNILVTQLFFHDPDNNMIEICDCNRLPIVYLRPDGMPDCSPPQNIDIPRPCAPCMALPPAPHARPTKEGNKSAAAHALPSPSVFPPLSHDGEKDAPPEATTGAAKRDVPARLLGKNGDGDVSPAVMPPVMNTAHEQCDERPADEDARGESTAWDPWQRATRKGTHRRQGSRRVLMGNRHGLWACQPKVAGSSPSSDWLGSEYAGTNASLPWETAEKAAATGTGCNDGAKEALAEGLARGLGATPKEMDEGAAVMALAMEVAGRRADEPQCRHEEGVAGEWSVATVGKEEETGNEVAGGEKGKSGSGSESSDASGRVSIEVVHLGLRPSLEVHQHPCR